MGYNGIGSNLCCGPRNQMQYSEKQQPKARGRNGNGSTKPTSIPSSGKYCFLCNEMVANGDPDGEDVPGSGGNERRHQSCVRSAIARGKNTELRETANL